MSRFIYYNNNPYGLKEEDCVTRAISLASGLDYFDISKKLKLTSELLECEKLCVCCYDFLIEEVLMFSKVDCNTLFPKNQPKRG